MGRPRTRCDPCHRAHLPCERENSTDHCTRCLERNYECVTSPTAAPKAPYPPRAGRRLDLAIKVCGGEGRTRPDRSKPRKSAKTFQKSLPEPLKAEEMLFPFASMDLVPSSAENRLRDDRMKKRLMLELLAVAAVAMAEPFMRDKWWDIEDNPFESSVARELLDFERQFEAAGEDPSSFGPWGEFIIKLGMGVGSIHTKHSAVVGSLGPQDPPTAYGQARLRFCLTLFRACANEFLNSSISRTVSMRSLVLCNMLAWHMPVAIEEDNLTKLELHRSQCRIFRNLHIGPGGFASPSRRKAWFECLMTADTRYSLAAQDQPTLTDQHIRTEMADEEIGVDLYISWRRQMIPIPATVKQANQEVWGTCLTLARMAAIVFFTVPRTTPSHAQAILVRLISVFEERQVWKATMWPLHLGDPDELNCHLVADTTFSLGICLHILEHVESLSTTHNLPTQDDLTRRAETLLDQCMAELLARSDKPDVDHYLTKTWTKRPARHLTAYLLRSRSDADLDCRIAAIRQVWALLQHNGFFGGMFLRWLGDLERELSASFGPVSLNTFATTVKSRWRMPEYGRHYSYQSSTSSASPQSQGGIIYY